MSIRYVRPEYPLIIQNLRTQYDSFTPDRGLFPLSSSSEIALTPDQYSHYIQPFLPGSTCSYTLPCIILTNLSVLYSPTVLKECYSCSFLIILSHHVFFSRLLTSILLIPTLFRKLSTSAARILILLSSL